MNRRLLTVLAAAGVASLALWLFSHLEKHEYEAEVGFRGEARRNPLLAAGFMLRAMGVPAESIEPIDWVHGPPAPGVFLLAGRRGTLTASRAEALLAWVERGGHLIAMPRGAGWREDEAVPDPLLQALGLEAVWGRDWWAEHKGEEDFAWESELSVALDGVTLSADVSTRLRLAGEHGYRVVGADEIGACAVTGRYGSGRVTVFCDPAPFTNQHIGEQDHAELLFRLATLAGAPRRMWLVYAHTAMPALPVWLWENAPQAVAACGLLLLVALWAAYPRFGPLQGVAAPIRRELGEHLLAAGQFWWRHEQSERLLSGARKTLHRFGRRRIVGWERKNAAHRAAELAELLGLPPTRVQQALAGSARGSRRRLLSIVQDLHEIRHRLEGSRDN